jgi:hypothetical protein
MRVQVQGDALERQGQTDAGAVGFERAVNWASLSTKH